MNNIDIMDEHRLSHVKALFDEARRMDAAARQEAETDFDYYHGRQWSDAELAEFRRRGQPAVTFNLVRAKVEALCGVEENTQTSPRAWPRTPADEAAASVATDTLRFVADINRFDKTRVDVLRDMLVGGSGAALIEVEAGGAGGRPDIRVRRLRWENFFHDPFSRESDFSDARYLGTAQWLDAGDLLALYGEAARDALEGAFSADDGFADRPRSAWADSRRRRVLAVEMYHREGGVWRHAVFTGGGLIRCGDSPSRDADGAPACPIEAVSAYIGRDNARYGVVRDMRSPQDEINRRRSRLLHMLHTRQMFRREGALTTRNPGELRQALSRPDGEVVLAANAVWGQDIGIIDNGVEAAGQGELLTEAKAFLDRLGPTPALVGRDGEETAASGRAVLARQQAGMAELATLFSAHNDWVLRVYRQVWARARQFWTAPMFVRVTDDVGAARFIRLNEPVVDADGVPLIDPVSGAPLQRTRLAETGVDLVVERAPFAATTQFEEFRTLAELAGRGVPVPPKLLILASSLSNKETLLRALEPPPAEPAPEVDALADAEIRRLKAEAAERLARAEKLLAEARKAAR
ncbi:MAG: hypothetical protein LBR29_07285 [Methylobacteriaceae bacterium]|jgi:hypothetical protein|nr:hypothetical protein [Methylobacteriaceae bacterium]